MRRGVLLLFLALVGARADQPIVLTAETMRDKVRGGLLGQILGNLNGLPHEMKYIAEPGDIAAYTPALPEGAWTDDDTDFEWVYILEMQRAGEVYLPPERIVNLWRERINQRIWCSNRYARYLMDLGIKPPFTGNAALNPWADFNISGQFLCETFGLLAPAMPQTAARIGLNYTRVAVDYEPAQTTQFFTTMIATAFVQSDVPTLLDDGIEALDDRSRIREIVADVRRWHRDNPANWRATRRLVKEKYSKHSGGMRDRNGYELNTASTVAALLYGGGDFPKTLRTAFNFGWDCDNTAATAGTIVGVLNGYRSMLAEGWKIVDRYENRTRDNMPMDETITSFADRLVDLAEHVIEQEGGQRLVRSGAPAYRIQVQPPAPVVRLRTPDEELSALQTRLRPEIEAGLSPANKDRQAMARAAYLAIALDIYAELRDRDQARWRQALDALTEHWRILQNIYWDSNIPRVLPLRDRATAAGLRKPAGKQPVW